MTQFDEVLLQVINDKQSGSVAVLQQLIRAILGYLIREQDSKIDRKVIKDRLSLMKGSLGHFEVVKHFLTQLDELMVKIEKKEESGDALFDFVKDYDHTWKNANSRVAEMANEHINFNNKSVLLHSNSSVVTSLFRNLSEKGIFTSVIQTESRPENEGRYQAEKIAALGHEVRFVVDAAAAFMMDKVDMMITGADQIHTDYFVNKIGTYAIALICREKNIPVYILADSRKFSVSKSSPDSLHNIYKPGEDIWKNHPENINPVNFYFEAIPTNLVTAFITEKEIVHPTSI